MIRTEGKSKYLGQFSSPLAAAAERDHWALILHGEFAMLNFPFVYA